MRTPETSELDYSVVLPVYNERDNLEPLIHEIARALEPEAKPFEIICVDDKSSDGSLERLRALTSTRPYVRVLEHRRNAGQSAALASGISRARGAIIITLDADGQNNPVDLPSLLRVLTPDVDAVCGVRQKRKDTAIRRISSGLANRFRRWSTGDTFQDSGCNFRVMRKSALRDLPVFNGLHRFIPLLLQAQGYNVIEVPISHRPRVWGTSKYGIHNRLWRGLADCMAMRWWKKRNIVQRSLLDD